MHIEGLPDTRSFRPLAEREERIDRMDNALSACVVACAVVLMFAPFAGRTTWVETAGRSVASAGAVWNGLAFLGGLAAVAGVAVGRWRRPGCVVPALGAALAAVAFVVVAAAAGQHWVEAISGRLDEPGWSTYPARLAPHFAIVALLGAGCALSLAIGWLVSGSRSA